MTIPKTPYPVHRPRPIELGHGTNPTPISPVDAIPISRHSCRIDFRIRWETLDELNRQYLLDPTSVTFAEFMRKIIDRGLKENSPCNTSAPFVVNNGLPPAFSSSPTESSGEVKKSSSSRSFSISSK